LGRPGFARGYAVARRSEGGKGGASFDSSMTFASIDEPRFRGLLASGQKAFLSKPVGWPEARSMWRVREPDAEGWRPCGCALERLNVRIMGPLCDVEPVPTRSRTARQQVSGSGRCWHYRERHLHQ